MKELNERKIVNKIRKTKYLFYGIGFIVALIVINLFLKINQVASTNYHEFIVSIIGVIEALILIFLTLLIYAVARAIIIMQAKIRLHKTCNSAEFYYAMHYMYESAKNEKMKEVMIEDYLYALHLDNRGEDVMEFIAENKEWFEKNKPVLYLSIQMKIAKEKGVQEEYEKSYVISQKYMLDKLQSLDKKKSKQFSNYQKLYKNFERNKKMLDKEYDKVVDMIKNEEQSNSKLVTVANSNDLMECYYYLGDNQNSKEYLKLCEEQGYGIELFRKRIDDIKELLNIY